jgi:hypothetical protein
MRPIDLWIRTTAFTNRPLQSVYDTLVRHSSVTVLVEALRYATYSTVYFRIANSRVIKHLRNAARVTFLLSGGWSPNWVHSARRPLTGLLYLPRVIVRMQNLVEWMSGETEVLGENLPRRHFVHQKSHLTRPAIEPGPPRWEASD